MATLEEFQTQLTNLIGVTPTTAGGQFIIEDPSGNPVAPTGSIPLNNCLHDLLDTLMVADTGTYPTDSAYNTMMNNPTHCSWESYTVTDLNTNAFRFNNIDNTEAIYRISKNCDLVWNFSVTDPSGNVPYDVAVRTAYDDVVMPAGMTYTNSIPLFLLSYNDVVVKMTKETALDPNNISITYDRGYIDPALKGVLCTTGVYDISGNMTVALACITPTI